MKKLTILLVMSLITIMTNGCSKEAYAHFVLVKGGTFKNIKSNYYNSTQQIKDFYMGAYEVTQKEWQEVMGNNPSQFVGDDLPVETVSWYDCIEYCNKRSMKEGLTPYYNIEKNIIDPHNICTYDAQKWTVSINQDADGYRLPTEIEWEYAASGGQKSKDTLYSGSDNVDDVAWYWRNAGDEYLKGQWDWISIENNHNITQKLGQKNANELGIYDMSGNVREWCWDWYQDEVFESGFYRVWRGGGLIGDGSCCQITYRGKFEPNGIGYDQGFRICRNA